LRRGGDIVGHSRIHSAPRRTMQANPNAG
jgi:hypothetical protein